MKIVYSLFHGNATPNIPFDEMKFKDIIIPEKFIGDSNIASNIFGDVIEDKLCRGFI